MIITWDVMKSLNLDSGFEKGKFQYRWLETEENFSPLEDSCDC